MTAEAWDNGTRCFGMLLDGRGQATGIKRRGADTSLLIVFNAHHEAVKFTLPPTYEAEGWNRLFDTTDPQLAAAHFDIGAVYDVTARSMLLFERIPEKTRSPGEPQTEPASCPTGSIHGERQRVQPVSQSDCQGPHSGRETHQTSDPRAVAPPRSTRLRLAMRGIARDQDGQPSLSDGRECSRTPNRIDPLR